jgi:iron complex outermembrane receptor protein
MHYRIWMIVFAGFGVATSGSDAGAQQPSAAAESPGLEEIVVTAQRREQRLLDVPVAVTSLSGEILDRFKIEGFGDLSLYTPGLLVQEQSVQRSGYNLRGLTQDDSSPVAEPSISIFVDGVDNSRQQGSITELIDIARAEIVRGPQGTLFGRGSVIGVISIDTRRPTQEFEGQVSAEAGSLNLRSISGIVNLPLVKDRLAIRAAARVKQRDGTVANAALPRGELNGVDTDYGRVSLRFTPTESVTSDLIVSYQDDQPPATQFKSIVVPPTGGDTSPFTASAQDRPDAGISRKVAGATWDLNWNVNPTLALRSIVAYREVDATEKWDGDGTEFSYIIGNQFTDHTQFSTELRASWSPSEALSVTAGVSYFRENVEDSIELGLNEQYLLGTFPSITAPARPVLARPVFNGIPVTAMNLSRLVRTNDRNSSSLYLNVSRTFFERLTVDAGYRYTRDDAETQAGAAFATLDGRTPLALRNGLFGTSNGNFSNLFEDSFSFGTPRLALNYRVTPSFTVFAGAARGIRSGLVDVAFTRSPTGTVNLVLPEKVVNYEAGLKASKGRFYADLSLFTYDYTDLQTLDAIQVPSRLVNAGKASGKGAETSVRAALTDGLQLIASYAYTEAQFDEFVNSSGLNLSGNAFRLSPEHKASVALSYQRSFGALVLNTRLTQFYQSKVFFNSDNLAYESQGGYGLTNVGIGLGNEDKGWNVEVFANNAFDKEYLLDLGNTGKAFGLPTAIRAEPRIAGVRFTQRW